MWQMILYGAIVLVAGFLVFHLLKKALKLTLFVMCLGAAYVALKYFLGVI
jgi:hypothetical protein|tara:strand:- start:32319 stop:32468 length:150 start_codon:yes stop_codon:yes gene_type:complete